MENLFSELIALRDWVKMQAAVWMGKKIVWLSVQIKTHLLFLLLLMLSLCPKPCMSLNSTEAREQWDEKQNRNVQIIQIQGGETRR